jgi:hypothetical protein
MLPERGHEPHRNHLARGRRALELCEKVALREDERGGGLRGGRRLERFEAQEDLRDGTHHLRTRERARRERRGETAGEGGKRAKARTMSEGAHDGPACTHEGPACAHSRLACAACAVAVRCPRVRARACDECCAVPLAPRNAARNATCAQRSSGRRGRASRTWSEELR